MYDVNFPGVSFWQSFRHRRKKRFIQPPRGLNRLFLEGAPAYLSELLVQLSGQGGEGGAPAANPHTPNVSSWQKYGEIIAEMEFVVND